MGSRGDREKFGNGDRIKHFLISNPSEFDMTPAAKSIYRRQKNIRVKKSSMIFTPVVFSFFRSR
ncbi:MAG: hypothetical protein SWX82_18595 [Cyanobacteriota bacterium]|nr:hypothetical protein [Cyanobacteriota bacterium]